jgi:hypothetical protein
MEHLPLRDNIFKRIFLQEKKPETSMQQVQVSLHSDFEITYLNIKIIIGQNVYKCNNFYNEFTKKFLIIFSIFLLGDKAL